MASIVESTRDSPTHTHTHNPHITHGDRPGMSPRNIKKKKAPWIIHIIASFIALWDIEVTVFCETLAFLSTVFDYFYFHPHSMHIFFYSWFNGECVAGFLCRNCVCPSASLAYRHSNADRNLPKWTLKGLNFFFPEWFAQSFASSDSNKCFAWPYTDGFIHSDGTIVNDAIPHHNNLWVLCECSKCIKQNETIVRIDVWYMTLYVCHKLRPSTNVLACESLPPLLYISVD